MDQGSSHEENREREKKKGGRPRKRGGPGVKRGRPRKHEGGLYQARGLRAPKKKFTAAPTTVETRTTTGALTPLDYSRKAFKGKKAKPVRPRGRPRTRRPPSEDEEEEEEDSEDEEENEENQENQEDPYEEYECGSWGFSSGDDEESHENLDQEGTVIQEIADSASGDNPASASRPHRPRHPRQSWQLDDPFDVSSHPLPNDDASDATLGGRSLGVSANNDQESPAEQSKSPRKRPPPSSSSPKRSSKRRNVIISSDESDDTSQDLDEGPSGFIDDEELEDMKTHLPRFRTARGEKTDEDQAAYWRNSPVQQSHSSRRPRSIDRRTDVTNSSDERASHRKPGGVKIQRRQSITRRVEMSSSSGDQNPADGGGFLDAPAEDGGGGALETDIRPSLSIASLSGNQNVDEKLRKFGISAEEILSKRIGNLFPAPWSYTQGVRGSIWTNEMEAEFSKFWVQDEHPDRFVAGLQAQADELELWKMLLIRYDCIPPHLFTHGLRLGVDCYETPGSLMLSSQASTLLMRICSHLIWNNREIEGLRMALQVAAMLSVDGHPEPPGDLYGVWWRTGLGGRPTTFSHLAESLQNHIRPNEDKDEAKNVLFILTVPIMEDFLAVLDRYNLSVYLWPTEWWVSAFRDLYHEILPDVEPRDFSQLSEIKWSLEMCELRDVEIRKILRALGEDMFLFDEMYNYETPLHFTQSDADEDCLPVPPGEVMDLRRRILWRLDREDNQRYDDLEGLSNRLMMMALPIKAIFAQVKEVCMPDAPEQHEELEQPMEPLTQASVHTEPAMAEEIGQATNSSSEKRQSPRGRPPPLKCKCSDEVWKKGIDKREEKMKAAAQRPDQILCHFLRTVGDTSDRLGRTSYGGTTTIHEITRFAAMERFRANQQSDDGNAQPNRYCWAIREPFEDVEFDKP
ncbi:hypothetical protein NPX13_g3140 [Xylaria arbuscula]|uniref:Uncharacterized protein n=1 Tax=Xylaria arbuscula TaxID=114810 RepID=A0A9W8NIS0_9PEZI|nr:hypothetical protein NPX13_g3140 [Xylaria arbuscula]